MCRKRHTRGFCVHIVYTSVPRSGAPLGSTGADDVWSSCSVYGCTVTEERNKDREVERAGRAKEGKELKQWSYGAAWTKWGVYFQPLHSGHTSPYGAFFTLHVQCCLCSYLQVTQSLFWTRSLVTRFSCCTLFVLNRLFQGADSLSHMLWEELLSIEVSLCSTLTWKDKDRHLSRGGIEFHRGSADVGSLTMSFSHPHS